MKIISREWTSKDPLGKRITRLAYGYALTVNGKRKRKFSSAWETKDAALQVLHERLVQVRAGLIARPANVTLEQG